MLRNLRGIFVDEGQEDRALGAAHKICLLLPDNAEEIKARGYLYSKLECPHQAVADYTRYLQLAPDAPDAAKVRERLQQGAGG